MKELNVKNSELLWGFVILATGFLIFVGITNSFRYLGFVFLIVGIIYFIRIYYSKSDQSKDESLKSKARDQTIKYRRKR